MNVDTLERKDQAMLLAQGYVQGQRDLLVQLLEQRFDTTLPDSLRTHLAALPAHSLGSVGALLVRAPDVASVCAVAEQLMAGVSPD
ncbi:MAG: hypothetical protein ACON3Z_07210 [Bradymonadia bacterium]